MTSDLFGSLGGLGNLLGGLAKSVVPQDTPDGKLLAAQSDLSDLQKQESALLLEIGRAAYEQNPSAWPQDAKLKLIHENMDAAKGSVDQAQQAKTQADADQAAADARGRCPNCGTKNPDGVKFCQECGTALGSGKAFCVKCGAELAPGTRFCGACGAAQG